MTAGIEHWYRLLDLEPGASLEQIKQAHRELVKIWHPDRFSSDPKLTKRTNEKLKQINHAYESLARYLAAKSQPQAQAASTTSSRPRSQPRNHPNGPRQRSEGPSKARTKTQTSPPPQATQSRPNHKPTKWYDGILGVATNIVILALSIPAMMLLYVLVMPLSIAFGSLMILAAAVAILSVPFFAIWNWLKRKSE